MGRKRTPSSGDYELNKMARSLDKLAFLEEMEGKLSPELWKDVMDGKSPEEILDKWKSYIAAKQVHIALFEDDPSKAVAAIKDVLDRNLGRPVEKKTVEHRLGKLPDAELKALVKSKLSDKK